MSSFDMLCCIPSKDEAKHATFSIWPMKTLGLDGVHAFFYQNSWVEIDNVVLCHMHFHTPN
ncbi:TPA_asm: hypothetical protein HUJ06_031787 [Nelumbo nucifera]|uniref:Uncharacterized protein n=1 Tax=Nelumbo nucifera TaxID=4432 RepID=A0A823A282_NELNU|nr:TPA_asm: hypothetical protein HUJ06_031787 [Nelumbo nucifera]